MSANFKYATQVWLTSIITSPILYCGLHTGKTDVLMNPDNVVRLIVLGWLIGGVLSSPNWLISYFFVRWVNGIKKPAWVKKIFIQVGALVLAQGLFLLFDYQNKLRWQAFWLHSLDEVPFYYWCTLSVGVWYFQLTTKKDALNRSNSCADSSHTAAQGQIG